VATNSAAYMRAYLLKNRERIRKQRSEYRRNNKARIEKQQLEYRRKSKERLATKDRAYYLANKQHIAKRGRLYRYERAVEIAVQKRLYRKRNVAAVRERAERWRLDNPDKAKACSRRHAAKRYRQHRDWLIAYKSQHCCVDCGAKHSLEFDHVQGRKLFTIGACVNRPMALLLAEIKKCVLRCKTCHIARHQKEAA
jgi:hypothetical protein